MPALHYTLPIGGTAPNQTVTKEDHEAAIQVVVNDLANRIDVLSGSLFIAGSWAASSGAFPTLRADGAPIQAGDVWYVSAGGTVDGVAFVQGDRLLAQAASPGPTYAGRWLRLSYDEYLATIQALVDLALAGSPYRFATFAELASRPRYSGATGDQINVVAGDRIDVPGLGVFEVLSSGATGFHLNYTGAGGVKLKEIPSPIGVGTGVFHPKVYASPTTDSSGLLRALLSDAAVEKIDIPAGDWRFDSAVDVAMTRSVAVCGHPSGRTKIILNHLGQGIRLYTNDTDQLAFDKTAMFDYLTVTRPIASTATAVGPKNLMLERFARPIISNCDSSQHIGYGVCAQECRDPLIYNVLSHDALMAAGSGKNAPVGTDGIHAYHCTRPVIMFCKAWNVGDDCISIGSFDNYGTRLKTTGAKIIGCYAAHTANGGGYDFYGWHEGGMISDVYAEDCDQAGIQFLTGESQNYVFDTITVDGATIVDCIGQGANIQGALRIRGRTLIGYESLMKRITYRNIKATGCRVLLSAGGFGYTKLEDLTIENAEHLDAGLPSGSTAASGIRIERMSGNLNLREVYMKNVGGIGIELLNTGSWADFDTLFMRDVTIDGYSTFGANASNPGILCTVPNILADIDGLTVRRQTRAAGVAPARHVQFTSLQPSSRIDGLMMDASGNGATYGGSSFITSSPRVGSSVPTTGTWEPGSEVISTNTTENGWRCRIGGTFGTLTGVTYEGTSGSYEVTLNSTSGIYVGQYLAGAWSGGAARVSKVVDGTTLIMSAALGSTVAPGTALAYSAPTFATVAL